MDFNALAMVLAPPQAVIYNGPGFESNIAFLINSEPSVFLLKSPSNSILPYFIFDFK